MIEEITYTVGGIPSADYQSVTEALSDTFQTDPLNGLIKLEIIADTVEGRWNLGERIKNIEIYNKVPHKGDPIAGTPKLNGATVTYSSDGNRWLKIHDVHFKNSSVRINITSDKVFVFDESNTKFYNILCEGGNLSITSPQGASDNPRIFNFKVWGQSTPVRLECFKLTSDPDKTMFVENLTILRSTNTDIGLLTVSKEGVTSHYDLRNIFLVNCMYAVENKNSLYPIITGSNNAATSSISFAKAPFYPNRVATDEFISIDPTNHDFLKLKPASTINNSGIEPSISYNKTGIDGTNRPNNNGYYSIGACQSENRIIKTKNTNILVKSKRIQGIYDREFDVNLKMNKNTTCYYVILPKGTKPPTPNQIIAGTDAFDVKLDEKDKGSTLLTAYTEKRIIIPYLTHGTNYKLYFACKPT